MDFLVEHGYRYLRILAGNEEPVWCANSKCLTKGFTYCNKSRRVLNAYFETLP
jgi:hypothetical protein